jgi:hypothetical protein
MDSKAFFNKPQQAHPNTAAGHRSCGRRAFYWLTLIALGGLALSYRHGFPCFANEPKLSSIGLGSAEENPARVWDTVRNSTSQLYLDCAK